MHGIQLFRTSVDHIFLHSGLNIESSELVFYSRWCSVLAKYMGVVDGLAQRAAFSFTPKAGKNVLAVLVHIPFYVAEKHNLANLETPTYVCSAGWDWMPRVPGLNSGITDDVYLSCSGDVTRISG